MGSSPDWLDPGLFVLRSVEFVKKRFDIDGPELCEAEAWALTHVLKRIQEFRGEADSSEMANLWAALSKNDERLADYMKKHNGSAPPGLSDEARH